MFSWLKNKILKKKEEPVFPHSDKINVGKHFHIGKLRNIQIPSLQTEITIGENVHFKEFCNLLVWPNAHLKIGDNVFFNNYCSINCLDNISIGANTLFGEGVKIYDHNHEHSFNGSLKISPGKFTTAAISIGANSWIGSNVVILKGVTIGDNVIIGACNLVYKSIPSNTIVKASTDYSARFFNQ